MSNSDVSLPKALWDKTLNAIVDSLGLTEVHDEDGGPYMSLESHAPMAQGNVGNVRLFKGDGLHHMVTCSISVPQIFLDSHMLFAMGKSDTGLPHFTLDSVKAGDINSFHLDLVQRLDLGSNLDYMNEVYLPLTETTEEAKAIEGLTPAQISPRQYAIMSPWMLVQRANDEAFSKIDPYVEAYLNHWLSLIENGISEKALAGVSKEELIKRDARNKAIIFDPEIDPVWGRIQMLIGEEAVEQLRNLLKSTST